MIRIEKNSYGHSSESDEQIAIFEWAKLLSKKWPELNLLYHIPNGGRRDIGTAKKLKAEGVKAGVPDLCLPVPRGKYHGMYLELKVGKNTVSDNQEKWIAALNKQGYYVKICYGFDEAIAEISRYLKL